MNITEKFNYIKSRGLDLIYNHVNITDITVDVDSMPFNKGREDKYNDTINTVFQLVWDVENHFLGAIAATDSQTYFLSDYLVNEMGDMVTSYEVSLSRFIEIKGMHTYYESLCKLWCVDFHRISCYVADEIFNAHECERSLTV